MPMRNGVFTLIVPAMPKWRLQAVDLQSGRGKLRHQPTAAPLGMRTRFFIIDLT